MHLIRIAIAGAAVLGPAWPGTTKTEHAMTETPAHPAAAANVYVGTYTRGGEKGIYLYHLDSASGRLTPAGESVATASPSFLALSPDKRHLYAVNELDSLDGKPGGGVSAFSVDPRTGALTLLDQQSTVGTGPCHLALDHRGRFVVVANYGSGSVCVLPVEGGGKLGAETCFVQHTGSSVDKSRQEGPHAHCVAFDAAGRVYVCDLGLDHVMIYHQDPATGKLTPNDPPYASVPPGAGPRHIVFHPNGRSAYVINEMGSSVTAFDYDRATGRLTEIQTVSTLPEGWQGSNTCAEVALSPDGRFLYGSNRGNDSIATFSVDPQTGRLTPVAYTPTGGKTPRNFALDPTGRWLLAANQDSNNLVVFRVDPASGSLTPTGQTADVHMPVCVVFR